MSETRDDGSLIKSGDERSKMFVGGLSWETDEEKLRKYFEQFGKVLDCTIKRDPESKRSRGFGFVLFGDPNTVDKVLASSSPHVLDGRNIDPKKAKALKKDHKLFVGGLNPDTSTDIIKEHFLKFGEIDSIERPVDRQTNKPRGFCFVSFVKDGVISDVIKFGKFHNIDGRQCECKDGDPKKQSKTNNAQFPGPNTFPYPYPTPNPYWLGQNFSGYDYSSGYGGYGSAYSGNGYGYYGYSPYGPGSYGGYGGADGFTPQSMPSSQQNTGGKAKTPGRGGQNNYKPY